MTGHPFDQLIEYTRGPALFGLTVLVHSTVVLAAGLLGLKVLTSKGTAAGARSVFIRICLAVAMITPVTAMLASHFHMPRFTITAPIPAPVSHSYIPQPAASPSSGQAELSQGTVQPLSSARDAAISSSPPSQQSVHAGPVPSPHVPRTGNPIMRLRTAAECLTMLFVFAWGAFSLFLTFRAVVISLYYRRMRRFSEPADDRHTELCRSVAGELGTVAPPVLKNRYVTGTFIVGLLHPTIMIPWGKRADLMTTREVFLHEIAHVVRRDHIWLHIGHLGKILLPFQPLVWVLAHEMEEAGDFACDDYVLQATGKQHDYAGHLVEIAASLRPYPAEARSGVGFLSRGTQLRRRIDYILDTTLARRFTPDAVESTSFVLLFFCTLAFTGLVGVRGKTLAQMKTLPETVARKAATAATATVIMVREQVRTVFTPPERTDQPPAETAEPIAASTVPAKTTPGDGMDSATTQPIQDAVMADEARNLTYPPLADNHPAVTGTAHNTPASGPAMTVTEIPASRSTEKPAFVPPASNEFRGAFIPPSLLDAHVSQTGQVETITVKPGPLTVTVPPETPAILRESLEQGQENPVWSPTGRIIAFTGKGGNGIWVVSANGGKPVLVFDTTPENTGTDFRPSVRILCFSPAGDVLAYVRYMTITPAEGTKKESAVQTAFTQAIETVNIHTGERRVLVKSAADGCWSPDSRFFAYVEGDGYGIRMLDTVSGETRRVTESGSSPTFTPDGASIIYTSWGGVMYDQLFRIPAAGGNPEQLTYDGCWLNPRCSPDGRWVLCSVYRNGETSASTRFRALNLDNLDVFDVYIVRTGTATMGTWSPKGNQYCFSLTNKTVTQNESVPRSEIYIEDFPIGRILDSMGTSPAKPAEFKLIGNFPNPFNASTSIRFSVHREGPVELTVYSMNGQKVRDLISGSISAGEHTVQWDGRDQSGNKVSSGVYISRLKMEREVETRRMTLVK